MILKRRTKKEYASLFAVILIFMNSFGFTGSEATVYGAETDSSISFDIVNPGFESGVLSGWEVTGDAFTGAVTSDKSYGDQLAFHQIGKYHVWGKAGVEERGARIGSMRSSTFTLGGTGEINFLIGGNNDIDNLYVSLVRASDGEELPLYKVTGPELTENIETYHRVIWDASTHIGEELYLKVVDTGDGHLNVDDFHVNVTNHEIVNPDFETGDLTGWTQVSGDDMSSRVKWEVNYWHRDPINKHGHFHLWGDDMLKSTLKSSTFELGGTGEINFLMGGGNLASQFVALMETKGTAETSDDSEIMRTSNKGFADSEGYSRVAWDASAHLGKEMYLLVVDDVAAGGWNHVNVDDFNVYNVVLNNIENPGFETGDLTGWTVEGNAFKDAVTDTAEYGDPKLPFGQLGTFHLFTGGIDEDETGTLTSASFRLGGAGEVNFLISGSEDVSKQYVELVNADDGESLFQATGSNTGSYKRVVWDAKAYVGKKVFIRIADTGTGHINADDFHVLISEPVSYTMPNEDFETSDFSGWTVEGNAFSVVKGETGSPSGYQRNYYVQGNTAEQGSLTSGTFRLSGEGKVNFKIVGAGDDSSKLYVALIRAADEKELFRASAKTDSGSFTNVNWDAGAYVNEQVYFEVVDQSDKGLINVDDFNYYVSEQILNPSFESGDIRGWKVVEGNAFDGAVTSTGDYHGTKPFKQDGVYHLWGFQGGGDDRTGIMESTHFILAGTKDLEGDGRITFLMGGGNKPDKLKVELIRDRTGEVLFSATGGEDEKYAKISWDATPYIGEELYFRVVDNATGGYGHLNIDGFRTVNSFEGILNSGFETGDASGWIVDGDAFRDAVKSISGLGQEGEYHLSGKTSGDPRLIGSLQSRNFELNGKGKISFLIGGGTDLDRLYVALIRASDHTSLLKATGSNSDEFREVTWDASAYVGEEVYLAIVDENNDNTPFGYISVDDFQLDTPQVLYTEKYRSQYHYTPEQNWMNDPNGMVYYQEEYHLFYQYHPYSAQWGPMHWGHAVSKDLVHWEQLPIAMEPDEDGMIFSGSAVVDWNNTSGFFNEEGSGLVAIYTAAGNNTVPGKDQVQSIAYSKDKGRTWSKYEGNPVLLPSESADFRDPKVMWHAETSKWIMTLAVKDRVEFYTSPNLKEWTYASSFGTDAIGSHRGVYECPDLIQIAIDGDPNNKKWVLLLSVGDRNGVNATDPEPPGGGSGMMYFIGEFDGTTFTPDQPVNSAADLKWVDFGGDYYAGVSWSGIEDGRTLWLGWMSNWRYAGNTPTEGWRSAMSIPRELELKTYSEGIRLVQTPVAELSQISEPIMKLTDSVITPEVNVTSAVYGNQLEIIAEFEPDAATTEFGFKARSSGNEETVIGYSTLTQKLFVDRTKSGNVTFHTDFSARHEAPLSLENGKIKMRIFVDWSSVEVFGNNGKAVITDLIFPDPSSNGLEVYSVGGDTLLKSLQINKMNSIWRNENYTKIRVDSRKYSLTAGGSHQTKVNAVSVTEAVYEKGAPMVDVTHLSTFRSTDPSIASVNAHGIVSAHKAGMTVIEAVYGGYTSKANITVNSAPIGTEPVSSGGGTLVTPAASITVINGIVTLNIPGPPSESGKVTVVLTKDILDKAIELAAQNINGKREILVTLNATAGVKEVVLQLPASYLSFAKADVNWVVVTPEAKVTIPGNLLKSTEVIGTDEVEFTVKEGKLPSGAGSIMGLVGIRPIIDLSITQAGKVISSAYSETPIKVEVNDKAIKEELAFAHQIIAFEVTSKGEAVAVMSSRYDEESAKVIFTTDHTGVFALALNTKTFGDLNHHAWALKEIETLASRGVINGTSTESFNPSDLLTRGDFLLLLTRVLELKSSEAPHFKDVSASDYYYDAAGIGEAMGIVLGSNGMLRPDDYISRQDMFVMTARALRAAGIADPVGKTNLSEFTDANQISVYAADAVKILVRNGVIKGDGNKLNPVGTTTRAEAAVVIYRIWESQR